MAQRARQFEKTAGCSGRLRPQQNYADFFLFDQHQNKNNPLVAEATLLESHFRFRNRIHTLNSPAPEEVLVPAPAPAALGHLIRADQLTAVRQTVLLSIPVNAALGIISTLVAWSAGKLAIALVWLACSGVINLLRILACRIPVARIAALPVVARLLGGPRHNEVDVNLRVHWILALLSGIVWAGVPALCEGYTTPETLFYLTCVCGITAGAVTHGFAYARIPICFITPPLLSIIACLAYQGDTTRLALSLAVLLYLAALIRGSRVSEKLVSDSSASKNRANAATQALKVAHEDLASFAEKMQYQAEHDLLTGLLSRAGFMHKALALTTRREHPLCMMFLDLDGFKVINDAYGHDAGDQVLIEVAQRLHDCVAGKSILARLGGDEFVIVYAAAPDAELPDALASRLIEAIARPYSRMAHRHIGLSIGIYLSGEDDINEMLVCSDAALYEAKRRGRNQFRFFNEKLNAHLQMKRDVERDLAPALKNRELQVWFQPIIRRNGSSPDGFEALLRWHHKNHGWIAPPDLIEIAALAGQSEELLHFIVGEVVEMIRFLHAAGRTELRVAMNISPRELERILIDDLVALKLKEFGLPAEMLEIEITEETAIDLQAARQTLSALSGLGVSLAIDDFGVGYSSLGFLRQMRVSRVKIDRSFVTDLSNSAENQALVQAVLQLSESFNFQVVAEGVESIDDLRMLQDMNCPAMQGYYFSPPMPAEKAREWLRGPALALSP
ncbi:bifunctional diguanylate cyclase/phosphodiesterase [Herbaspirillum robiniae]|uniref:Bifunctional diguanylate cyclase/phosphodiesterase n=1 Tax=Herbaspirillum robiniae TaxID=2014887 RepID=A0ABX2M2U5_9BURK|nr:bifunctional diguanylate cyclase/phosphodiesterase [Herbaspirillum robiniae]